MNRSQDGVNVERRDGVLSVRLTHAESRNSLDMVTFAMLRETLRAVDPRVDRVVVLASETPGMFCSGLRLGPSAEEALRSGEAFSLVAETLDVLAACPVVTIALVDGSAIGAGCELALRCDVRIATEAARFAIPATALGLPYPLRSLRFLVDRYGADPLRLMFLGGAQIAGAEAQSLGLVQRLVPDADRLERELELLADHVRRSAPLVLGYHKRALREGDFDLESAERGHADVLDSQDFERAVAAIAERGRVAFSGD